MRTYYLFTFLFCTSLSLLSQTKITGSITYHNKSVSQVDITIKDSYNGGTSSPNGVFEFYTSEKGDKTFIFSHPDFETLEKVYRIEGDSMKLTASFLTPLKKMKELVLQAGSLEASDKKRAAAALTPMDIYNTAGANGQITEGYKFLPGVQKTGEVEGLFVRGGTGAETQFFMDGNLINNYFTASVPGLPGQGRFNTNLFTKTHFSTGGYSALYGQALSAVLVMESVDMPEKSSAGVFALPFSVSGDFQKVNTAKTFSYGIQANYFNLTPLTQVIKFNTNFITPPQGYGINANFRWKNKKGGLLKYYGNYDTNRISIIQPSLEIMYDEQQPEINGTNTFHSLSFKQKIGKFGVQTGASFSLRDNDFGMEILSQGNKIADVQSITKGLYFNHKTVLEYRLKGGSNLKGGYEFQYAKDKFQSSLPGNVTSNREIKNAITAFFAESNIAVTPDFSVSAGLRTEYSDLLKKWNLAPRITLAYRLPQNIIASILYGKFYQMPSAQNINLNIKSEQVFQKATHYIFQVSKTVDKRMLRLEAFYKKYEDLDKNLPENFQNLLQSPTGAGYAKGAELFWRDRSTFKDWDYRISYSYLDSEREFQNYPKPLYPAFASRHTASLSVSKFITSMKTGIGMSYAYASPRPVYNIIKQNGQNVLLSSAQSKDFNSLNFSMYFLPNIGKKDAKSFTILIAGINNILNSKNVFGGRFSQDGMRSTPILPSSNRMVYVGVNFNFGIDKTQDTIDNL